MSNQGSSGGGFLLLLPLGRLIAPFRSPLPRLLTIVLLLCMLGSGACLLWQHYRDRILDRPEYLLTEDKIEVTPRPPWVPNDIRTKAVVDGSLSGLKLTRPDLAVIVADAFALHPWIAKVNCSRKTYGRVIVDLQYRTPVAMVLVSGGKGVFPVDAHGIVLPPEDFSQQQVHQYLLVQVRDAWPSGGAGEPWGDRRVQGAARVASALASRWRELGLRRIVATESNDAGASGQPTTYHLTGHDGTSIMWGHAPGQEIASEPSATKKVRRLWELFQQQGSLDTTGGDAPLDLSTPFPSAVARRPTQ